MSVREPPNLTVKCLHLLLVRHFEHRHGIACRKQIGEPFQRNRSPISQNRWCHTKLGSQLREGFRFLQELKHDLCFECCGVNLV